MNRRVNQTNRDVLSIFRFIARHSAYLFFLLFCGLSILIMQLQRKETLDAIRVRSTELNASVSEQFLGFGDVFSLRDENDRLLLQNARLFAKVIREDTALRDTRDLNGVLKRDSTRVGRFFVARIVDRRFSPMDNMLVINAGSSDGIEKEMAVLTPEGLVGRVTAVSQNYARVMPVINKDFKVSVVSDSSGTLGVLSWKGGNEYLAHLENVPSSSRLKVGERLTTSDHSTFAIRGLPVGRVARISGSKLFSDVDVRLAVDFPSLSYVLVSSAKPSREKLEIMNGGETKHEPGRK
ncbi:MAG: rod shape-determining protein MreC [Chlorobiaceae bacterium]|nr:rod shape-determining protein MreC [Chlorobiaceae bacterium]